jgi:hypothetical protein
MKKVVSGGPLRGSAIKRAVSASPVVKLDLLSATRGHCCCRFGCARLHSRSAFKVPGSSREVVVDGSCRVRRGSPDLAVPWTAALPADDWFASDGGLRSAQGRSQETLAQQRLSQTRWTAPLFSPVNRAEEPDSQTGRNAPVTRPRVRPSGCIYFDTTHKA